jgi:RNA polymerase sigma factor (TIGR02999 family)
VGDKTVTDLTTLLAGAREGDGEALDRLFSELYGELRQLAHTKLRRNDVPTLLDTTSLVHESYLRFLKAHNVGIADQAHFMAYAARVMRSVVVDFARERSAQRRGGQDIHVPLDADVRESAPAAENEVIRVHQALEDLAQVSDRLVQVVEMRYFGGMSELEIADALGVNERTVRRDWEKARILLVAALK